ncbi:MAG: 23S rRNA (adenine(2030)-N(6))-methyltransferase RlmJ [Sphingomonadales bacterium]|nr:23S rRNA (adenine(2030)-N(6))-methyltransferase RlmJ [Sphingomonadales bacterium]
MTNVQARRESHRVARRQWIQEVARGVFAEHGFDGSSIEQIARAAHLSVGSIYLYFRSKDDLCVSLIEDALTRFATGIVIAWYPIKDARSSARLADAAAAGQRAELMQVELQVRKAHSDGRLAACGLLVANPPFGLKPALDRLLPFLVARLGTGQGARSQITLLGKDS